MNAHKVDENPVSKGGPYFSQMKIHCKGTYPNKSVHMYVICWSTTLGCHHIFVHKWARQERVEGVDNKTRQSHCENSYTIMTDSTYSPFLTK